jgi:hypothetical protein
LYISSCPIFALKFPATILISLFGMSSWFLKTFLITFGEGYKIWSSELRSFLHSSATTWAIQ